VVQSPSSEADSYRASQEFSRLLLNPKFISVFKEGSTGPCPEL